MAGTVQREVPLGLLPHLRTALGHIDLHFADELDLDRLAAVAGVSKYHFARSFEAAYGEPPMRYLTRRRIERAQDLLRSANLTITEICMMVGYASLGSFSARFTELIGESPSAYRARWEGTGGPHIPGCYLFMWGMRPIEPLEQAGRSAPGTVTRTVAP
jgi:AraC-like DNA-binding protein